VNFRPQHDLESQRLRSSKDCLSGSDDEKSSIQADCGDGIDGDKYFKRDSSIWNRYDFGIVVRAFVMTFISEIGDRSQITTIVLAAHKNPWGVTFGATGGHAICTGFAVVGGKLLASRISERNVAIVGGILFLLFGAECFITQPDFHN